MDEFVLKLESLRGLPFVKMTGSGNDFVFFDGRVVSRALVTPPEVIRAICNRFNGIGADGIVVLEPGGSDWDVQILYFNSDGTPADLCGNATLCSLQWSSTIGLGAGTGMSLHTPAGLISGRLNDEQPEIDLQPVSDVRTGVEIALATGETRIGFAQAGIPHLVVLCDEVERVDVTQRGPELRRHSAMGSKGANVNWVSGGSDGSWRYRTFERGVEGETLACGTGAIATAILLSAWGLVEAPIELTTRSGRALQVRFREADEISTTESATSFVDSGTSWYPSLRGEGRVVFSGHIASLAP